MNQRRGAGHHAITRTAVHELFRSRRGDGSDRVDPHLCIDGLTEHEYFSRLDRAQQHQDRWWDADRRRFGPTTRSAWTNPEIQREHSLADPYRNGPTNLALIRDGIVQELHLARGEDRFEHLGKAIHALEDSYSNGHLLRGDTVTEGDPTAPVQAINTFRNKSWGHDVLNLFTHRMNTHDGRFDRVPLDRSGALVRGSDQAAAHAVAAVLGAFHDLENPPGRTTAEQQIEAVVAGFLQADAGGVDVHLRPGSHWKQQRDERLRLEREQVRSARQIR